jgi:hypothetical protein
MEGACSMHNVGRGTYSILPRKTESKNHLEYLGVNGRIILKLNFKKWHGLGGAYGTRRRKQKYIQSLWLKTQKKRRSLENLGADGNIILKWVLKK